MRIPLSAPDIDEDDIEAVVRVLRSSRLSLGPVLGEFESCFAEYVGVPAVVAVSSGTAGLHLALLALGIGVGDEVIVPSFTFIAAANAIRYVGAVPVFVDIDPVTLNMDAACVERAITQRTKALMVVHTFGCPADIGALLEIAERHGLKVIEDACEAIGAEYQGRRWGHLAMLVSLPSIRTSRSRLGRAGWWLPAMRRMLLPFVRCGTRGAGRRMIGLNTLSWVTTTGSRR